MLDPMTFPTVAEIFLNPLKKNKIKVAHYAEFNACSYTCANFSPDSAVSRPLMERFQDYKKSRPEVEPEVTRSL